MIQVFQTNFPPQNTAVVDKNSAVTTPWMAFFRALYDRTGQGNGLTNQVGQPDANGNITTDWVLGGNGFLTGNLPALQGGQFVVIQNNDLVSPFVVNAPTGAMIDVATSYSLPAGKMQIFWFFSSTQIFSTQLG